MEGSEARPTVRMRWRERAVNGALVLVLVGSCVDAASGLGAGASDGGSRRSLLVDEAPELCRVASQRGGSLVDYRVLHHCRMRGARATSVALMLLVVALVFWILGDTAERYFCPVVKTLADRWNLAPATAGVTLLALGNGAPDVFASLAAATSSTRNPDESSIPTGDHAPPPPAPPGGGRDRERGDVRVLRRRRRGGARRRAVPGGPRAFPPRRPVLPRVYLRDGADRRGREGSRVKPRRFPRVTSYSSRTSRSREVRIAKENGTGTKKGRGSARRGDWANDDDDDDDDGNGNRTRDDEFGTVDERGFPGTPIGRLH